MGCVVVSCGLVVAVLLNVCLMCCWFDGFFCVLFIVLLCCVFLSFGFLFGCSCCFLFITCAVSCCVRVVLVCR